MASEQELQIYREVGKITAEIRDSLRPMVKPGEKLLNIAETAENKIKEAGLLPAFPCNVSVNEIAAHYSPPAGDETTIQDGDIVSVDIGAHLDGYIADTAFTVATGGKNQNLVDTVESCLEKAIAAIKPGVGVGEIGAVIEETARVAGLKPISNLTGHSLDRYRLHAGITIPNVKEEPGHKLKAGDVLAIEPFVTSGAGEIEDKTEVFIFRFLSPQPVQRRMTMELLREISRSYGTLPFAERWLAARMSKIRLQIGMRDLMNSGVIHPYHVLKDKENGPVAQAEHTVIVTEKGCDITTLVSKKPVVSKKPEKETKPKESTSSEEQPRDQGSKD